MDPLDKIIGEAAAYAVQNYCDDLDPEDEPSAGWMLPVKPKKIKIKSSSSSGSFTPSVHSRRYASPMKRNIRIKGEHPNVANFSFPMAKADSDKDTNSDSGFTSPVTPDTISAHSSSGSDADTIGVVTFRVQKFSPLKYQTDMSRLVDAVHVNPGQHVLRMDPLTGQLYACIPLASWFPKPEFCDHCQDMPTKILDATMLCRFHSFFLTTGRFLSYYEQLAMEYLDFYGLTLGITETIVVLDLLEMPIKRRLLVAESSELTPEEIHTRCKWGAIGEPVPKH